MKVIETNDPVLPKQAQFIDSTSPEVLYSGAFGAGKTRAGCLKARQRATTPGAIEGLCRKNLVSLKRTTLRTLLEPDGDLPPVLMPGTYEHHKTEGRITLNDGGTILTFGLDDPQKIGSLNLTGCFVDEATELAGADWTALRGRLRGGGDRIVRQLYGGCNPSGPSHHLAVRFGFAPGSHAADGCKAIQTCSSDNWFLPADYLKSLHTFEGLAYKRFVLGLWVASDRLVYDMWDREKHVQENKGPWSRVAIGVDAGYTNPAVLLAIGEDYDGRLHVFDEFYKSGVLEADFVAEAVKWNARYSPERFVVDPSAAGLIASMRGAGLPVIDANNARQDGVQAVRNRLKIAGDGRPRLTVSNLCSNTIREAETWETVDRTGKEEFSKTGDHTCFIAGTMIETTDGPAPIECLRRGDIIRGHDGAAKVVASENTGMRPIYHLTFSDGRSIICTGEHPIATATGWVAAKDALGRKALTWPPKRSLIAGSVTAGIRDRSGHPIGCISSEAAEAGNPEYRCIGKSGWIILDRSRRTVRYITRMGTRPITIPEISNAFSTKRIAGGIRLRGNAFGRPVNWSTPSGRCLKRGIKVWQAASGIQNTRKGAPLPGNQANTIADIAENRMKRSHAGLGSAPISASRHGGVILESIMSHDSASFASVHSPSTAIARRSVALSSAAALSIVKIQKLTGERLVYNLSTESGTYYANGILVSNCDALRYACMYFDSRQPVSAAPWAPASADVECNRDPEFAAINLDLKDF